MYYRILARVGDLNLDPTIDDGATPLDIPIKRIIRHKEYDVQKYTNNIALLVLKNIVSFTALIQPICLPQLPNIKNMDMGNSFSFIAGWGDYMFRGPSGTSLKEVQVPIINLTDCINAYKKSRSVIDDRMICAGEEGKDACSGDIGGPLMWFKEKQFYLMGIVSYGYKCGEPNSPGVYTRVPYYLDWILERINS
ncbi:venom serine protease Bi-VSP [Acyrthosiphon pisum]|uniref:Peptidase S1 domain-containing protein n=1 Tax=Acyrthosiphon pisum TaxID=7029 RepID=A0A8R2A9W0_ACYPI|nr:venom serine protease Bi-VSP [Acyrthosiphon pisum]|eukprot:XP_003247330.1 PREDICTED: venom serine protease Bi-VSP [Acyrthosiphon pisum]